MKSEFSVNQILALQAQKKEIEKLIRESVGIVPENLYYELDLIELKLLKVKK